MTNTAQLIKQLIDKQISKIATLDIGTVSGVVAYNRVSVKLKHQVNGQVVEYTDIPVLPSGIGKTRIYSMPQTGDTVIIAFLMFEAAPQLERQAVITKINEQAKFIHPVVLAAINTDDDIPGVVPAEGETIICQSADTYIKFTTEGNIEIVAPSVTVNGTEISENP